VWLSTTYPHKPKPNHDGNNIPALDTFKDNDSVNLKKRVIIEIINPNK
jgi:hypothetical protein